MNKEQFYSVVSREKVVQAVRAANGPGYLFFKDILQHKYEVICQCLAGRVQVHYAVKANPSPMVLEEISRLGLGADVASGGELQAVLDAGIAAEKIEFSGPGKRLEELQTAMEVGIGAINVESLSELKKILILSRDRDRQARIGVRINPDMGKVKTGLKMAGNTQFGISEANLPEVFALIRDNSNRLLFQGIHLHIGSQVLEASVIAENMRIALNSALKVEQDFGVTVGKINFGGGWGINYFENQAPLNLSQLSEFIGAVLEEPAYKGLVDRCKLIVEPGRFLVGECGLFFAGIVTLKQNGTLDFAVLDGGMNHNYLLAGGMGQVIRRNFEIDAICQGAEEGGETKTFTVVGPLCTPQDVLANNVELPEVLAEEDTVLFFNCGAYGASASPLQFLSHPQPCEEMID